MMPSISFSELLFYVALGTIGIVFNLSYFGQGVLMGLILALFYIGRSKYLKVAALGFCVVGALCLWLALDYSANLGMTFEALNQTRSVGKLTRRMPFYAVTSLCAGIVLLAYLVLGKLEEKYDLE
jgi:hypothetical protein